jgi:hypothetical protein
MYTAKCLLLMSLFFCACNRTVLEGEHTVMIDIQAHFESDLVQVYIDGRLIGNNVYTTLPQLGLAGGLDTVWLSTGMHRIKTRSRWIESEDEFTVQDKLYIGIGQDADNRIRYQYSNQPFLYD